MAVPEQIPVVNYVADGIVKKFDVPFEYDQQSDLHVYVDGAEPTIDKYYFDGNAFNFYIAPTSGQAVKIKRITPKERDTDYNLHTNTVRPKALNTDFDRLWYVLQEVFSDVGGLSQAVQDEIIARIQGDEDLLNQLTAEISARMLGDEAVTEDLKNYVDQVIGAIINDPDFDGIDADKVNDASGETQQQVNYNGGSKWHSRVGGYKLNERVVLTNVDIVKSTIEGNTNDPNVDMSGWVKTNSASQIFDESGKTQQEINNKFKDQALNLDDFKTSANTDADALYAMLSYAKLKGIKSLNITRDIALDRKITLEQDATNYLNNLTINTNGHNIHYTGAGADSLYIGVIEIKGVLTTTTTTVVGDHAEYTSDLTVASTAGFSAGDYILIRSAATTKPDIYLNHVVKIESITGNTLGTDTLRRLAASPSVAPVNVTKVNTVNNFKLLGNSKITANGQTARVNGISGVVMTYASDSQVVAKSEGLWFKTISANNCHRCTIIGVNKFAVAKGGGEGYCVQLQYSTHCIAKGTGEYLRHTTDCTASWHCTYVDCSDYYASSGSFIHHCASEYNINYFNCHSYGSQTNAFALGTISGVFSDFSDKIELINCSGLMSKAAAIAFANKGKGLTVRGGTYDPDGSVLAYSITSSNNDTNIYGAYLPKGVQCATSADMYTGGVFKIHYSDVAAGGNTRALNISENRHVEFFGGTLSGRWTLADATTVEMTDTNLIYPASAQLLQLIGTGHKIMQVGGKQTYPVGATVAQALSVSEYIAMNVKLVSNGLSLVTSNSSAQTTYSDMFGIGAISITGGTNVVLNDNKYTANGSNIAMTVKVINVVFTSTMMDKRP